MLHVAVLHLHTGVSIHVTVLHDRFSSSSRSCLQLIRETNVKKSCRCRTWMSASVSLADCFASSYPFSHGSLSLRKPALECYDSQTGMLRAALCRTRMQSQLRYTACPARCVQCLAHAYWFTSWHLQPWREPRAASTSEGWKSVKRSATSAALRASRWLLFKGTRADNADESDSVVFLFVHRPGTPLKVLT